MGNFILKIKYKLILILNGLFLKLLGLKVIGIPKIDFGSRIYGIKNIKIGKNFIAGNSLRLQNTNKLSSITIGNNVNFNDRVHIASEISVKIGNNCLFASNILITDHGHGKSPLDISPIKRKLYSSPVVIGDNVWIGENCVIYKGVTIKDGAIIGANSFVNKDVGKGHIVVGNPAKKI